MQVLCQIIYCVVYMISNHSFPRRAIFPKCLITLKKDNPSFITNRYYR
jgi:hypothetical protein